MKKLTALLLAVMLVASMVVAVSAESTTTLTTTVPAATYTLNIPADQEIPFGTESKGIGELTVTDAVGFAEGKNLNVTFTYDAFKCEEVSTTIPFVVAGRYLLNGQHYWSTIPSGNALVFTGKSSGELRVPHRPVSGSLADAELSYIEVQFESTDWGKALGGEYTATITFTAEVVAG